MAGEERFEFRLESTTVPCERLRVQRVVGLERISRLFSFEVDVACVDREGIDVDKVPGADVAIVIDRRDRDGAGWSGARYIHGMVSEVADLLAGNSDGGGPDVRAYRLVVVPRLFSLALVDVQDIFMGLPVPKIIERKLTLMGLAKGLEPRLTGAYPDREFVVQYRESDLAFISRLAEHDGISFFFQHDQAGAKLVFTDHAAGFSHLEGEAPILFRRGGGAHDVFDLELRRRVIPSYYAVRDYNYRKPNVDLMGEHEIEQGSIGGSVEYGDHFKTPEEGKALARVRGEERLATQLVYTGKSNVPALFAGARFKLEDHPDLGGVELLVIDVEHDATQVTATGHQREPSYVNTFRAIPADRTYRPPRITPKPRIAGLMTAVIDTPAAGGTKYAQIDEQGRYLVRFFFDAATVDERPPSRRVRMLQNHVGENYGTHFPLRPGVEVAIGFVDGDPDRPLIVGAVPNPHKPSPVTNANPGVHRIKTATGIVIDMVEDA